MIEKIKETIWILTTNKTISNFANSNSNNKPGTFNLNSFLSLLLRLFWITCNYNWDKKNVIFYILDKKDDLSINY